LLPNVEGRIDHLSADVRGQRVFVSALGNDSVEVVDFAHGQRVAQIKGLKEPQGVLYVPANQTLYIANGEDGSVRSFDARTMRPLKTVTLGDDADNLRFDAERKLILVGYGSGAIATLNLDLAVKSTVKLPVHPESFQLTADGQRLFVNLPRNRSIAVVDRGKQEVSAQWKNLAALANFPMALDEEHHRLFLACRIPTLLLVVDTNTGSVITRASTVEDADDLFYDRNRKNLYVIGGEGYIDVLHISDQNELATTGHVNTSVGARTGLFVPVWNRLFVAAPHRGSSPARLFVYSFAP
jgi:DNA-binding beta-propeller fold protein YncE